MNRKSAGAVTLATFGTLLLAAGCERSTSPTEPSANEPPLSASVTSAAVSTQLAALRHATAAFRAVEVAVAAGYAEPDAAACVEAPGLGAMGVHSVNFGLASDLVIDPLRPEVLLYLPKAGGGFRLVGVEYFEVALVLAPGGPAPWFSTSPPPYPFFNPAPSVFGQTFDGPMAGHEPGMPWHYDKHVWIWAPNPNGDFAPFNPRLSCPEQ